MKGFYWDACFVWVSSWSSCWSCYWNGLLTGTLCGTAREVAFPDIFSRGLNDSLWAFSSLASGISGALFCGA